jgi:hypothetical protein
MRQPPTLIANGLGAASLSALGARPFRSDRECIDGRALVKLSRVDTEAMSNVGLCTLCTSRSPSAPPLDNRFMSDRPSDSHASAPVRGDAVEGMGATSDTRPATPYVSSSRRGYWIMRVPRIALFTCLPRGEPGVRHVPMAARLAEFNRVLIGLLRQPAGRVRGQ